MPTKYMHKILLFLFFTLSLNATNLKIASYNVENLFDMQNNTTEYKAYKPNKHNWTRKNFQKKLLNISEVICDINADIIGLQEIENEHVLKLLKKSLKNIGCHYKYHAITHKKHSAIQVALLSKIPITSVKEIIVNRKLKYRHILEAKFMVNQKPLYLFVNHWSSKRSAESTRMVSARALVKRLKSLAKGSEYILLGDFNADYDEYLHMEKRHNDVEGRTGINHILKSINNEKFFRKENLTLGDFRHYNLWLELPNYKRWSHNFYGNKQALDAILLPYTLFDGKGIDYVADSFSIFKKRYLFHKKGYIFRWEYKKNRHKGKGYSDHLPIVATFSTNESFSKKSIAPRLGTIDDLYDRHLAKLGSGEFTPTIGEAKAITSDEFYKMSNQNAIFPILLKRVKIISKEKNKVLISQKESKNNILIYGTKKFFTLGNFYDVMVYACKDYKGEYEIIDFEIEKRYDSR